MRIRPTLEAKFIALASVLILLGSVVVNLWIIRTNRNQLISEAERRALLLAESTAISFTNILLYEELDLVTEGGLLENHIRDLISDTLSSVREVTVYDGDSRVIATNDYSHYFERINAEQVNRWLALTQPHLIRHAEKESFEILFPLRISTKRFGTLYMRFTLADEYAKLAAFKNRMLLFTIGLAIAGILIALFVARTLARPIKRLVAEMHKVQEPTYTAVLDSKRRDEIGDLERGFVDMLNRLKWVADEKERQQKALIQTEKLASVGTLVSGLTHEINNPLAGIRSCLRRIIGRPDDANQTRKYARLMDTALLRIEKVVKDLLNFARKKELVLQRTDLNQIIKAAHGLVDYRLKEHKLELKLQLTQGLSAINGDPQHLEQVFINLLFNAIDVTPEGGCVAIKTDQQDNKVVSEVTDCGKGIPSNVQDKIFDPFFTTKAVGKGTGLGLSVTKAIVEEHHGSIEVLSDTNGTTFRLYFPIADKTQCRCCDLSAAVLAGGSSVRMEQNKALLSVGGNPMIDRVVETLKREIPDVMIISNHSETYAFLGLPTFPDAIQSCGPLSGILTALLHAQFQHCLVVACDLPFVSKSLVHFLCENAAKYDVLAFETESGVEPLCAVYSKRCVSVIREQIQAGQYKVSDFYDKVKTRIVRLDSKLAFYDPKTFFNVNTKDDLAEALQLLNKS